MALFRGIQEYIALNANNIVSISGNIFLYPPQSHPILYNYYRHLEYILNEKINKCAIIDITISLSIQL